jgi:hypothetical protein
MQIYKHTGNLMIGDEWACFWHASRSKSHRPHDHILLSHLRHPNMEAQVPIFISPRNRMVRLYSRALGSLVIASYDSQGYSRCFLTGLHTGHSQLTLTTGPRYIVQARTAQKTSLSTILCSLLAGETMCSQSCSLARVPLLSPVYTAVTLQWIYMSHYCA